jgi:uncharacterized protein YndB with AHSA1/START domain
MMKPPFLAVTLFAATIAIPVHAQDNPGKPADSELKVVLDSWNDNGRKFIAMAEDFPEGDDFKSNEIFIAAPPARVFQAISDPSQLQRWWGQHGLYHVTKSSADVRAGGKWRSDGVGPDGKEFFAEGEYLEVDPPRRLVHTWVGSYDPTRTVVRWELEPQTVNELRPSGPKRAGTGTRLRITQEEFAGNLGRRPTKGAVKAGSVRSAGRKLS